MDLDRTMVKLCGGSMVIEESIAGRRPQVPGHGQESLNDRSSTVFFTFSTRILLISPPNVIRGHPSFVNLQFLTSFSDK